MYLKMWEVLSYDNLKEKKTFVGHTDTHNMKGPESESLTWRGQKTTSENFISFVQHFPNLEALGAFTAQPSPWYFDSIMAFRVINFDRNGQPISSEGEGDAQMSSMMQLLVGRMTTFLQERDLENQAKKDEEGESQIDSQLMDMDHFEEPSSSKDEIEKVEKGLEEITKEGTPATSSTTEPQQAKEIEPEQAKAKKTKKGKSKKWSCNSVKDSNGSDCLVVSVFRSSGDDFAISAPLPVREEWKNTESL